MKSAREVLAGQNGFKVAAARGKMVLSSTADRRRLPKKLHTNFTTKKRIRCLGALRGLGARQNVCACGVDASLASFYRLLSGHGLPARPIRCLLRTPLRDRFSVFARVRAAHDVALVKLGGCGSRRCPHFFPALWVSAHAGCRFPCFKVAWAHQPPCNFSIRCAAFPNHLAIRAQRKRQPPCCHDLHEFPPPPPYRGIYWLEGKLFVCTHSVLF